MPASDDLIRQLIEARFAGKLSPEEVETLLPYVRRGQATSERLASTIVRNRAAAAPISEAR